MKVVCFDLDDTLYKEIDYLHAAYRLIAQRFGGDRSNELYYQMLAWYETKEDVFQMIVSLYPTIDKTGLLNMYRYDVRKLSFPTEIAEVLMAIKESGVKLGLITDGRFLTQKNKIIALGLDKFFDEDMVIISETFGSEKPSLRNYKYFMNKFPGCESFAYVGDNLAKDFVGANALGWKTICLLDDGRNIHKQDFEKFDDEYLPNVTVASMKELLEII